MPSAPYDHRLHLGSHELPGPGEVVQLGRGELLADVEVVRVQRLGHANVQVHRSLLAPRRTGLAIRFLRFDGVVDVQQAPDSAANCGRVTNAWLVP